MSNSLCVFVRVCGYSAAVEFDLKYLCVLGYVLPLLALGTCLLLSLLKDFDEANKTHCRVYNVLPSISASVSQLFPQNTIWRLAIGVDSFPRYLIAFVHHQRYYAAEWRIGTRCQARSYVLLTRAALVCHLIELTSLLVLTYVSSGEIFVVHKLGFVAFLLFASLHMLLAIASYYWPTTRDELEKLPAALVVRERRSLVFKRRAFGVFACALLASLYFYVRHNRFCEPMVYSLFSLSEYVTVLANVAYHAIIFHDLDLFAASSSSSSSYKLNLVGHKSD